MSNFARVNSGGWGFKGDLTNPQMNQLDIDHTKAINGDEGSEHDPTSKIILGGQGLELKAPLTLKLESRSVTRVQSMAAQAIADRWTPGQGKWINQTDGGNLFVALDRLPHGCRLNTVTVYYKGASGHAADPVTSGAGLIMPSLEVVKTALDGTVTSLGSVSDPTTGRAAFEAVHSFSVGSLAETIDCSSHRYSAIIVAESGGDYVAGAEVYGVTCTFDVTQMDEG